MHNNLLLTGGALVLLIAVLLGWRFVHNATPLPVAAQVVDYRSVPDDLQAIGSLRAVREVNIRVHPTV